MVANGATTGRCYLDSNKRRGTALVFSVLLILTSTVFARDLQSGPAKLNVNRTMLKNFVKSLIIPGWGQYSSGHKIRAITFLTAELAGIYGYQVNYTGGADGATEFKAYADIHWDYGVWSANDNGETACGGNLRTHEMPIIAPGQPLKDHHFYENIGKYPEFSCGWDDYTDGVVGYDYDAEEGTNKAYYIDMRTESNQLYRNAQVAGTLVMVNHLISAFDAALGTDITSFETTKMAGNFYINPLSTTNSIGLEVKF